MHKSAGDACSYKWADYTVVSGSCLTSADNKLLCAMADVSEPPALPATVSPGASNAQEQISSTHSEGAIKGATATESTSPDQSAAGVEIAPHFLGALRW